MEDELKKEIRRQFLADWVSSASIDEIVAKLIENDERAKKINKAIKWVNQHISKYNCRGITIIDWNELSSPNDLLEILGDKE